MQYVMHAYIHFYTTQLHQKIYGLLRANICKDRNETNIVVVLPCIDEQVAYMFIFWGKCIFSKGTDAYS